MAKHLPMPPPEACDAALRRRGWDEVDGCWVHRAVQNRDGGYTLVRMGGRKGRTYVSSRLAYAAWVGKIPEGHVVCHTCDNPPCINPEHLFTGTMQRNIDDMWSKGRGGTAKYTAGDVRRVVELREQGANYSQIARLTGMSRANVQRIIGGKHRHRKTA